MQDLTPRNKKIKSLAFISIIIIFLASCSPILAFEMPSWLKNEQWEKVSGDSEDYIFTTSDDIQIAEYATFFYSLKNELQGADFASSSVSGNTYSLHWERSGTGWDMDGNSFSTKFVYDVSFTRLGATRISFVYERELTKGDEVTYVKTSGVYKRG